MRSKKALVGMDFDPGCCWALLGAAGCCWVLLGAAEHCWALLGTAGCRWELLDWTPLGAAGHICANFATCSREPLSMLNLHFVAGEHGFFGGNESKDIRTIFDF